MLLVIFIIIKTLNPVKWRSHHRVGGVEQTNRVPYVFLVLFLLYTSVRFHGGKHDFSLNPLSTLPQVF